MQSKNDNGENLLKAGNESKILESIYSQQGSLGSSIKAERDSPSPSHPPPPPLPPIGLLLTGQEHQDLVQGPCPQVVTSVPGFPPIPASYWV